MRSHAQSTFADTEAEIAEAVDFVVHVERQPGRRVVREVLALRGYDRDAKRFLIEHQQRAGVLGSLGLVADSLRLLPNKGAGNGEWSATEWAETRQGWIFITSLPAEREALRPLQSLRPVGRRFPELYPAMESLITPRSMLAKY